MENPGKRVVPRGAVLLRNGEIKICLKNDGARELHELRRAVAGSREYFTVPTDVPVTESKGNGGMEKAARTLSGQYRTLKSHLE